MDLLYGWWFEETLTACTFPQPLPAWLFDYHPLLTDVLLYFLCEF